MNQFRPMALVRRVTSASGATNGSRNPESTPYRLNLLVAIILKLFKVLLNLVTNNYDLRG